MRKVYFVLFFLMVHGDVLYAQVIIQKDPVIENMVNEVSADTLKSYIEKLVSFGTRHTLSSTSDPRRGIGAAREWVTTKFREFAAKSNGRMTAELDKWNLPADNRRIDTAADMGTPMAIFKGSDPADTRIFII